jgi:cyclopropane-fatty-acyl-phospholipid synthase
VARRCLEPGGLFLLHTIGRPKTVRSADPWIHRYIFPNGHLPSLAQLTDACEGRFVVEDVHNFGADYDRTLLAWFENFDRAWPALCSRYDGTFYRMWKYYLLSCAGAFRARDVQLWQLVLSPEGVEGGYRRPR